ncbi:D-Ala-D-Ala carboxypeptidase family metallohydrolase [Fibrella forsythiae]|uniref:Peptidase M15A C-terminal domain-containing protein n=1 Tax=Fibrella forsythiae TaxID=2817061 RepID=A0ABS3JAC5_9BACT|nr:D-Ala-D-Ala carboxypeptidase family metallohydrolase [Fibrella forsythiae]MBO0946950.1 hypothetical protein [Fibrella forsythiae]
MTTAEMRAQGLGKWCNYAEATHSTKGEAAGLDNTPTQVQWENMQILVDRIYAPLCEHYLFRLPFDSFFRSPAVNKLVGGSSSSAHVLGQAIDIDCDGLGFVDNIQLVAYIRANFIFDQLILEFPDKNGKPSWVHVSFRAKGVNRKQVLRARKALVKKNGKLVETTVYDPI